MQTLAAVVSYHLVLNKRINKLGIPCFLVLPCGAKVTTSHSDAALASFDDILVYKDYWLFPEYEPRPKQIVMDVGASLGLYTLTCAKSVGVHGHVYAIEPEPVSHAVLLENIRMNKLPNTTTLSVAIADFEGSTYLYVPTWSESSSSLYDEHISKVERKANVRVKTLDCIVKEPGIPHVDLLKIDVEGAETAVVRGASRSLRQGIIGKILVEIHEFVSSTNLQDIEVLLRANGYVIDGVFQSPLLKEKKLPYARLKT